LPRSWTGRRRSAGASKTGLERLLHIGQGEASVQMSRRCGMCFTKIKRLTCCVSSGDVHNLGSRISSKANCARRTRHMFHAGRPSVNEISSDPLCRLLTQGPQAQSAGLQPWRMMPALLQRCHSMEGHPQDLVGRVFFKDRPDLCDATHAVLHWDSNSKETG
jgi:hypothetical protein